MTDTIQIYSYNAASIKVDADMGVHQGLYDHFAYHPPGYRWMPAFKNKIWDGYIRSYNLRSRTLPVGLIPRLQKYADSLGVPVDYSNYTNMSGDPEVTIQEIQAFADSLDIHSGGKKIIPHDYQIDTVFMAISTGRMVALAPTSSGKSLILYIYLRWFLQNPDNKCLMIVPSVQLVHQMFSDFSDYSSNINEKPVDYCHLITSGKEKQSNFPLYISTWQSLQNIAKGKDKQFTSSYFEQFDVVAVDEVHTAKSKQLNTILDLCTKAYTRLGVTGTTDGSDLMQIQLEGLFGPIHQTITTKELMDRGSVSTIDIKFLMLTYPEDVRKNCTKLTYQDEIDFLVTHPSRLKFTTNLASSLKGNTLILCNFVQKHGKPLYDAIKTKVGDTRKVFFVHGGIDGEERNEMTKIIENETDAIIIGSYGCLSTGVSIKRLHNVIFASPSKSQIRVLQSLGRGLRLGSDKNHCILYDIGDDLSHKKHKNFALAHAVERIKMYSAQQFNYKLIKVDM